MTVPTRIYHRVLVPLDGSEAAEFAIRYGADLANKHNAELMLLHLNYLPVQVGSVHDDDLPNGQTKEAVKKRLDDFQNQLHEAGLHVLTNIIDTRDLRGALLDAVESEHISAIVMSTQGRTNMLHWLFGNQVEQALSNMPVPVMLVRPLYHKIVVPLDGSRWSESAILRAAEIARVHDAELILLHVYQSPVSDYSGQLALAGQQQIADQSFDQIREQLVSLRNRLRREGINAREQLIRGSNPAKIICEYVETEEGTNMVVMSTHGRTGLSRWLVGSVAQRVIKNSRCPVMLVRPDES
ncbi:MAG: universal stress protein [Anaerolineae bacterium]|nr:universal stress protein [Anaerolineae bacterium]